MGRPGTWKPGQSGNVNGRPPGNRAIATWLREQLTPEEIEKMLAAVIARAIKGDLAALTFIADRLDGKPRQALEHSGTEGRPILIMRERWDDDTDDSGVAMNGAHREDPE